MTYLPTDEPATKTDILAVKSDIQDVKSAIAELKSELTSEKHGLEQRLGQRIDGIETRLNQHDLRFDSVHEAMRQQTRSFILASTGMMVTLSAVAFGAATRSSNSDPSHEFRLALAPEQVQGQSGYSGRLSTPSSSRKRRIATAMTRDRLT